MADQLTTKAAKEKQRKRKSNGPVETERNINNIVFNSTNNFIKRHTQDLNMRTSALIELNEQYEKIKFGDSCKNATINELKLRLETKSKELDEVNGKFEILKSNSTNLQNSLLAQSKKYANLEVSYGEARCAMEAQLKLANEQMNSLQIMLDSKEAECAVYLKDMQSQLENANKKNVELESSLSDLNAKVFELEGKLETIVKEETIEKQNLAKKYEKEIQLKEKKVNKKNKKIAALEKNIENLENEKKELLESLALEGHKIRDLQRVLNRPIIRGTTISDDNERNQRPANPVEPYNETNSSNWNQENQNEIAAPNSSHNQIIQQNPFSSSSDHESDNDNNFVRNTINEWRCSSSASTVITKRTNTPQSCDENVVQTKSPIPSGTTNQNIELPLSLDTGFSSDEGSFPGYEFEFNTQHSPLEAKRARK